MTTIDPPPRPPEPCLACAALAEQPLCERCRREGVFPPATDFDDGDLVLVSGPAYYNASQPSPVERLLGTVATTYEPSHPNHCEFKIWPSDESDGQLDPWHDGKIWFVRGEASVLMVRAYWPAEMEVGAA